MRRRTALSGFPNPVANAGTDPRLKVEISARGRDGKVWWRAFGAELFQKNSEGGYVFERS